MGNDRAKPDDGLRSIFHEKLKKDTQWTVIETWQVSLGVPDSEYCFRGGCSGWIEFKRADAWKPKIRPLQASWIGRRARLGGRVWVGVRRAKEELWLIPGAHISLLTMEGLKPVFRYSHIWDGGPDNWNWTAIRRILNT